MQIEILLHYGIIRIVLFSDKTICFKKGGKEMKKELAKRTSAFLMSMLMAGSMGIAFAAEPESLSEAIAGSAQKNVEKAIASVPMETLFEANESGEVPQMSESLAAESSSNRICVLNQSWGEASPARLKQYIPSVKPTDTSVLEVRAKVEAFAGTEPLGMKVMLNGQRMMFKAQDAGHISYCNSKTVWANKADFAVGNDWHVYRFECDGAAKQVTAYVDGTQLAVIDMQQGNYSNGFEIWSGGGTVWLDYVRVYENIPESSVPVWDAASGNATVKPVVGDEQTSLAVEWPAAISAENYTVTVTDTLNENVLHTESTTQTSMTLTGLKPGTGYNVTIEASNAQGTSERKLKAYGDTRYNFSSASGLSVKNLMVGGEGYANYRIPCLVATTKGTLLAVAEARASGSDWAPMDAVLMRSEDGGETWSERVVLAAGEKEGFACNNPILIPAEDEQGRSVVLMVYCKDYGVKGHKQDGVMVRKSVDDGLTWSEPMNITANCRPDYRNVIATGPGHGIQLKYNKDHKGRLLVSVWLTPKKHNAPETSHGPAEVTTLYSDDMGDTWQMGDIIPLGKVSNPNESTVVELSDGRVMVNMRNTTGNNLRAVSVSPDGTSGWCEPYFDKALNCPVCFASLTRYDDNTILFVNPDNTNSNRIRGTVKVSYDDGKTWPVKRMINESFSGYADIAVTEVNGTKQINVLLETVIPGTTHNSLTLYRFPLSWVTEGTETQLKTLTTSAGKLNYQRDVYQYEVKLNESVNEVTLAAAAFDENAVLTLDGKPFTGSATLPVAEGENKVVLHLESSKGSTDYTISFIKVPEVKANSRVLHYTMDAISNGFVKDSSGYCNNAQISGDVTVQGDGKIKGAANLQKGSMTINNPVGLDFGTGDFTASMWLKPRETGDQQFLFWYGTLGTGANAWWARRNTDGSIQFLLGGNNRELVAGTPAHAVPADQWSHITLVRRGDVLEIYVNGEKKAERAGAAAYDVNGDNLLGISLDKGGRNRLAAGLMDEVSIYNYALDANQIHQMANVQEYLYGASLSLEGDIGVNFFYEFSPEFLKDPEAKVEIAHITEEGETLTAIPVKNGVAVQHDGRTLYRFSVPVAARCMTEPVRVHAAGTNYTGEDKTITIREYGELLLNDANQKEELRHLVRAMLNYGAHAQQYKNYRLDELANKNCANDPKILEEMSKVTAEALDQEFKATISGAMPAGLDMSGVNLSLTSKTTLRFAFKPQAGYDISEYHFTVNGTEVNPESLGGFSCIEIANILPQDLGKMQQVTVTKGEESCTISYSPMSYVRTVLSRNGFTKELRETGKALRVYGLAAEQFLTANKPMA